MTKNIYLLPTQNNKSKLASYHYDGSKNIKIGELGLQINNIIGWTNCWSEKELYIISGEEKAFEGDYYELNGSIFCARPRDEGNFNKVILTTDQSLDGVQAIDNEFLEWFVKNPSCETIKVEGHIYKGQDETEYKIIIPKVQPKKEALEDIFNSIDDEKCRYSTEESDFWYHYKIGVLDGLKWQQERSYSEEEVYNITQQLKLKLKSGILKWQDDFEFDLENWFEQFKN